MGTQWRGLLAPVNQPTDDGRRFLAFSHRDLPVGLKWQRTDADGHDDSVVVGSTETINIGTIAEAAAAGWISPAGAAAATLDPSAQGVWGGGELFDDVSTEQMPRLAQDVAEAKLLLGKGVIAPSVDPIPVGAVFMVEPGSDEPITSDRWDQLMQEAMDTGVDPPVELLFEEGMIGAATLVVVPAFSEVRPFELLPAAEGAPAMAELALSLTAAAAAPVAYPADAFTDPGLTQPTPISVEDRGEGFLRVFGFAAAAGVCHAEFRDVCWTAPTSLVDYLPFHRYPLQTDDGQLLGVGRITFGGGRVGTGCTCRACRGKDDHACSAFGLGATISHYDRLQVLAWVRTGHDEAGNIWVAGVTHPDLDAAGLAALKRQRFSGDWREVGGHLELVEVLALSSARPGFPIPATAVSQGRQVSLTAAGVIRPDTTPPVSAGLTRMAQTVADLVVAGLRSSADTAAAGLATQAPDPTRRTAVTAAAEVHTGAMVALRMADDQAAELALDGGEPAHELHLTNAFLGEATDLPPETQQAIIDAMGALAAQLAPVNGELFAADVFNPNDTERDTAAVLGVSGAEVATAHAAIMEGLAAVLGDAMPAQHQPFAAHVTLAYTDDLSIVEQLAARTGKPILFDRIRCAFAGAITDIPLTGQAPPAEVAPTAASLADEVTAALALLEDADRAQTAADLIHDLEAAYV